MTASRGERQPARNHAYNLRANDPVEAEAVHRSADLFCLWGVAEAAPPTRAAPALLSERSRRCRRPTCWSPRARPAWTACSQPRDGKHRREAPQPAHARGTRSRPGLCVATKGGVAAHDSARLVSPRRKRPSRRRPTIAIDGERRATRPRRGDRNATIPSVAPGGLRDCSPSSSKAEA
jgi:hypothetical protein